MSHHKIEMDNVGPLDYVQPALFEHMMKSQKNILFFIAFYISEGVRDKRGYHNEPKPHLKE